MIIPGSSPQCSAGTGAQASPSPSRREGQRLAKQPPARAPGRLHLPACQPPKDAPGERPGAVGTERPDLPASSAPSSQARSGPQPSREATKAAASSTLGPLRAGRPRVRPPPVPPRCPAAAGDRKRPSRSRFMAAAPALRPVRLRSAPLGSARQHSGPLGPLVPAAWPR